MLQARPQLSKSVVTALGLMTVALVGLSFDANKAEAATLTQTRTISLRETDWDRNVNFQLFNPSYGTLNSVTITLTGTVTGSGFLTNNSDANLMDGTYSLSARLALFDPEGNELAYVQPIQDDLLSSSNFVGIGQTRTYNPVTFSDSQSFTYTSGDPFLASFIGLGTRGFGAQGYGYSEWDGDSNVAVSFNTLAGVTYEVTYDFTGAVPEPMTILGAGVAAAFGTAFKRRSLNSKKNPKN